MSCFWFAGIGVYVCAPGFYLIDESMCASRPHRKIKFRALFFWICERPVSWFEAAGRQSCHQRRRFAPGENALLFSLSNVGCRINRRARRHSSSGGEERPRRDRGSRRKQRGSRLILFVFRPPVLRRTVILLVYVLRSTACVLCVPAIIVLSIRASHRRHTQAICSPFAARGAFSQGSLCLINAIVETFVQYGRHSRPPQRHTVTHYHNIQHFPFAYVPMAGFHVDLVYRL